MLFIVAIVPQGQAAFTNEVRILQMLSAAEHNNVIKYYGLHDQKSMTGVIIEYCAKVSYCLCTGQYLRVKLKVIY